MPFAYKILGQAVTGSTRAFNTISNKALTSNVATLTTGSAHGLAVGDVVQVLGVDTVFDGAYSVATVPTTTTFTFARTNANVTSAAVSPVGVVIRTHGLGGVASASKYAANGLVTVTTGSAHGLAVNDWAYVTLGDANTDGKVKVLSVPSATTFTYVLANASVASTAVTTGAVSRLNPAAWTTLYASGGSVSALVSTIVVANLTTSPAQYRIATSLTTSPSNAEIVLMDCTVPANDTATFTMGATMQASRNLMVLSNSPEISFTAYGTEVS